MQHDAVVVIFKYTDGEVWVRVKFVRGGLVYAFGSTDSTPYYRFYFYRRSE
ncbi:MAG: hypothetical protein ACE5KH_01625 [Candidatus Geothermarchaeales archaeon]